MKDGLLSLVSGVVTDRGGVVGEMGGLFGESGGLLYALLFFRTSSVDPNETVLPVSNMFTSQMEAAKCQNEKLNAKCEGNFPR